MKSLMYLLTGVLALSLGACTVYLPIDASSGSLLQAELPYDAYTILGKGEGTSCGSFFLGFPLGDSEAGTFKQSVGQAVGDKGGDFLIKSTADLSRTFFYPIYFEQCVVVEGLVAKLK